MTDTCNSSTWKAKAENLGFKTRLDNIVRLGREKGGERRRMNKRKIVSLGKILNIEILSVK